MPGKCLPSKIVYGPIPVRQAQVVCIELLLQPTGAIRGQGVDTKFLILFCRLHIVHCPNVNLFVSRSECLYELLIDDWV